MATSIIKTNEIRKLDDTVLMRDGALTSNVDMSNVATIPKAYYLGTSYGETGTGENREIVAVVDSSGVATGQIRVMDGVTDGGLKIPVMYQKYDFDVAATSDNTFITMYDGFVVPVNSIVLFNAVHSPNSSSHQNSEVTQMMYQFLDKDDNDSIYKSFQSDSLPITGKRNVQVSFNFVNDSNSDKNLKFKFRSYQTNFCSCTGHILVLSSSV